MAGEAFEDEFCAVAHDSLIVPLRMLEACSKLVRLDEGTDFVRC